MKKIPLSQGKFTLVSNKDYKNLCEFKWFALKHRHTFYAARHINDDGVRTTLRMHRVILNLDLNDRKTTDHRDRNGLNNQRNNLRIVSNSLNSYNRKMQTNNTSGYRGVYWHKQQKKWAVYFTQNNKKLKFGGLFSTPELAAYAYDKNIKKVRGKEAILNFSDN
jgi:hypothetical protein